MIASIVIIAIGLVVWKLVPGWIEYGNHSIRQFIQLLCNIIGIIMVIAGAIDLFYAIIH